MESSMARAFHYLITAAEPAACQGVQSLDKQGTAHTQCRGCDLHSAVTKQPRADFFVFGVIHQAGVRAGGVVSQKALQS